MPPTKKRKLDVKPTQEHAEGDVNEDVSMKDGSEDEPGWSSEGDEGGSNEGGSSPDTEDEIALAHMRKKSKKTAKRKIRASSPSQFGSKLEALLSTTTPSAQPLALKKSVNKRIKAQKEELRAKKAHGQERKEHEEVGRITDVIGGWGGENERALRKVAQRGVIQLFNVIQKAQQAKSSEETAKLALRGSGKPTLEKPDLRSKRDKKKRAIVPSKDGASINAVYIQLSDIL
ncbi:SubName: Full=Uncharacterized protein {ECO:0000313/EMBL:CCA69134.1} [Serendipita indica DSM 11827]|nr:SubName: Full=Uncharacterized protein {ECO:0000313/EMBL:CCA69134.1} [Serendipita indica DSM 11827]